MHDQSLKNVRQNAVSELIRNGISQIEATLEVDILLDHIFGLKRKDIIGYPDTILQENKLAKFYNLISRRVNEKLPVQYLTHKAYFMGYEFYVDENVLIPRPETELLVEEVVNIARSIPDKKLSIIDIGTGSGCIAGMLAKNLDSNIVASDISEKALEVAKYNAKNLGLEDRISFRHSDIFSNIEEKFDIIVSNPPYIPIKERESLQFEVSGHEPHLALFAEDEEGISFYKKLISQSKDHLNKGGYFAVEIGISQSQLIKDVLEHFEFKNIRIIKDFSNIDRVIIAQLNS